VVTFLIQVVSPLPPFALWPALPTSDYYGGTDSFSVPRRFTGRFLPATPAVSRRRSPTFTKADSPRWFRWRLSSDSPPLFAVPDPEQGRSGFPALPFGLTVTPSQSRVGPYGTLVTAAPGTCVPALTRTRVSTPPNGSRLVRVTRGPQPPGYIGYLRGGACVYRRLKPASLALTVSPLCQARPLGGLCRAAPGPFRASFLTTRSIPGGYRPKDTSTACTAYGATDLSRFAHSAFAPRGAP